MTRIDRIGVDLGSFEYAASPACASAVAELGARTVRVRFGLAGHLEPDSEVLQAARQAVDLLRGEGLTILAVIDSDLTVAPEGMGAFSERPLGPLARAWTEEMRGNAGLLAEAIGEQVAAWEILPLPNAGSPQRIAPARWAQLLGSTAEAIRAASPGAILVAGALLSDEREDGLDYLEAAMRATGEEGSLPVDALGIRLEILPEGEATKETLAAMLIERVQQLRQRFRNAAGQQDLIISGIGWDAESVGEEMQSRNVWTALDALTAQPEVRAVIWSALADGPPHAGGACGLFRGLGLSEDDRRPAWRAFRDFATYSRQISPPMLAEELLAPDPGAPSEAGYALDEAPAAPPPAESDATAAPESEDATAKDPDPSDDDGASGWTRAGIAGAAAIAAMERREALEPGEEEALDSDAAAEAPSAEAEAEAEATAPEAAALAIESEEETEAPEPTAAFEAEAEPEAETAPEAAPAAEAEPETEMESQPDADPAAVASEAALLRFRIPNAEEVLRGMGLEGEGLGSALEAVRQRYGNPEWLPPGEYSLRLPAAAEASSTPADATEAGPAGAASATVVTNQNVISALYRAGGGTWRLFERAGLELRDLAARRTQAYSGPDLAALPHLGPDEQALVDQELEALISAESGRVS